MIGDKIDRDGRRKIALAVIDLLGEIVAIGFVEIRVNGRGSRTWALPEEEMAEKLVKMGIPKTAIYETKLVSPAKAEKRVWEKRDGTKVSLTPRQMSRMEQEYVIKMAGKLTEVPESDSRPAVVKNAAPMFSAVEAAPAAESVPSF